LSTQLIRAWFFRLSFKVKKENLIIFTLDRLPLGTFARLTTIVNLSRLVNVGGAVADISIAASLIYLLQGSRTGFSKSDSIINRLIMFSLNTGLLTSLDAIASLVTISVLPNTFVYIMFYVTCSRCAYFADLIRIPYCDWNGC
jgi:hypothetical protein